ncbi:MAG: TnpV protein [Nitrospinae bacterium]|nr:TnpV protein [Nitrospinota bacterium]MBF0634475.1 TnpV protein [Nitrospinota bacterium]
MTNKTAQTQIKLDQMGQLAITHWRENRPQMFKRLKRQGKLLERAYQAQEATKQEMDAIVKSLLKEDPIPANATAEETEAHLSYLADRAWEMTMENHILLPAEEDMEEIVDEIRNSRMVIKEIKSEIASLEKELEDETDNSRIGDLIDEIDSLKARLEDQTLFMKRQQSMLRSLKTGEEPEEETTEGEY